MDEFKQSQFKQLYKLGLFASLLINLLAYALYSDDPVVFSHWYSLMPLIFVVLISCVRIIYGAITYKTFDDHKNILFKSFFTNFYLFINVLNAVLWGVITTIIIHLKGLNSPQTMTSLILIVGIAASATIVFATVKWLPTLFIFSILSIPSTYLIINYTGTGVYLGLSGIATCFLFHFNAQLFYKYYMNSHITEIKLKQQTQFLKKLIDSIPGSISYVDANGVYQLANQPLLDQLKLKEHQFIGKAFGFYNENKEFLEFITEFRYSDKPYMSRKIKTQDEVYSLIVAAYVSENKDFLIISFDVTNEIKLEKEVENQNRQLEHASRLSEIGEITAGIVHEINNAIFTISLINQDILKKYNSKELDSEYIERKSNNIEKQLKRVQKIILSLKTLSRRSNENDLMVKQNITSLISDALDLVEYKISKKNVRILNLTQECNIYCHPTEITQIVLNLLNNATDALESIEQPEIKIESQILNDHMRIIVTDNGPGIPQNLQNKIMNSFFTTKESGKGTGLGLSISQKIAKKHGGKLYLNQDYYQGAQFILELPLFNS